MAQLQMGSKWRKLPPVEFGWMPPLGLDPDEIEAEGERIADLEDREQRKRAREELARKLTGG